MEVAKANIESLAHFSVESAPMAIYWVTENGIIANVNEAACQMLGYDRSELIGAKVPDINPEFSIKSFREHFLELIQTNKIHFESTQLTKEGKEIEVEIVTNLVEFEDRKYACSFITDIAARKRMEHEMLENEERWKVGLEILNEGVWDWDLSAEKVFFSRQFAENLGYKKNQIINFIKIWNDIIHPDDKQKYKIRLIDHLKGLTDRYESEHRLKTQTGEYRWFKDRGMVIKRDANGRAIRMIGSSLDVTERIDAEKSEKLSHQEFKELSQQALAESQSKFQNILNYSNDAILILEAENQTIAEANPKASQLFGIEKSDFSGRKISEFLPKQESAINSFLDQVIATRIGHSEQFVLRDFNGENVAAEVSASYLSLDNEKGILAVIQPVSDEKHIESILNQIVEEALSKTRMDFVPNFIEKTAAVVGVRCVGISQVVDQNTSELQVVSLWNKDKFEKPYRYGISGAPVQKVFEDGLTYFRDGVSKSFPKDVFLTQMNAEGYLAVPVFDSSKRIIGHFFMIDDKPLERKPWVESLLKIGANRMGLEIERKKVEDELKERVELEGLVSEISTRFINTTSSKLSESISWALKEIGEYVKVDRSYIFKLSDDKQSASTTNEWVRSDIKSLKKEFQLVKKVDYPWPFELLESKRLLLIQDIDDTGEDLGAFKEVFHQYGIKSMLNVPMVVQNKIYGFLGFDSEEIKNWSINDIVLLKLVAEVIVNTIERVTFEESLKKMNDTLEQEVKDRTQELSNANEELESALNEVKDLRDKLEAENIYLKEEIESGNNFENIISQDKDFKKVLLEMEYVAKTTSTVLILGETGTGKEVISKALHNLSDRKDKPLIKINCAALPATLIESELFGHEKGAFTGAANVKQGRFELASGGTLFLDEVGEMPIELQPKLLRALQEGEIERLGGTKTIKVDVRLIAATNKDLEKGVEDGTFRSDLFYRLNVFPINIPPLRDRKDDIRLLVNHFVQKYNAKLGKQINKIPQNIISQLEKYNWPGNVRELENIIERAVIISPSSQLKLGDWFLSNAKSSSTTNSDKFESLEKTEKAYITKVLSKTNWKISGPGGAAEILDLKPTTLESRIKKLGITKP
ncbi:sigma 54-interacting transcriptional regulator [Fulvivirga lutimaris]|uniref:sigma 54-interacting transcriptional regulator n=1 Tax=Fulvivirga lutimaris TaxID=1819566 RepID=UPI0012BD66E3|nr:sigma 54-interacting transcriptional regulator [Fulvivirga lutimaris]MTI41472.1 PAS domain S-box protein [Fulvivirga lutimaris]